MRTFAITLACVPALVLVQGLPTTLVKVPSPPATITSVPSIPATDIARRAGETSPCPTTTADSGLLDILRREEDPLGELDTDAFAEPEVPQATNLPRYMVLKKKAPSPVVGDRDLGLPSLPAVLGGSSTSQHAATEAISTARAADSEVTPAPNATVVHEAQNGTAPHNGTLPANLTSTFTSYPSPKATKTDFRFDSAAVNGAPSTSAPAQPSQTVVARQANDTSSAKNSTGGLDLNSKYVCSADVIVTNTTDKANGTVSGTAAMGTGMPANTTKVVSTAYHCYERPHNATTKAASRTSSGTTLLTVTTKPAESNLTNAEVSQTITDTFSVTSLATHPATTTSTDMIDALVSSVNDALPST